MESGIIGAVERITSRQNAIVRRFRALARASSPADDSAVLLDGEHLIEEAIACDVPIEIAAFSGEHLPPLSREVERRGGRVLSVPPQVLEAMSPVRQPSGVVAIAAARTVDLASVFAPHARGPQLVIILAGLQDPGNVGAIVRTAAAFGATGIVAIEGSANPFGWKALRGAMGATFRLPIAPRASLADTIVAACSNGVRLLATAPRRGIPLPNCDFRPPVAVILGGEGAGVTADALAAADATISIPMRPPIESLNVATAAAIVLYEAARQRGL
jgi:RNA methyltransferase, TrmH family